MRTFIHSFYPPAYSPAGRTVGLTVSEIEDAGIREVLQTPGAAYGAWSMMDALLTATGPGTPFIFKEPLGQAREVKVALSGLFGRFVARAYLERYFGLAIFAHLGNRLLTLSGRRRIEIVRRLPGDLPDWVACAANLSSLTVAEAKGCHDPGGPAKALARAWAQTQRIDVMAKGRKVTIKRIAVATRWGAASAGPAKAHLSAYDPEDEGDPVEPDDKDALFVGLLREHIANLIAPLGHQELATALRQLAHGSSQRVVQRVIAGARAALDSTQVREVDGGSIDGLVGGVVTRAGPITNLTVAAVDQDVLARLNLRPVFVGVERDLISAAIDGEAETVRKRLTDAPPADDIARSDRAGGWIVPLGGGQRIIKDA
ncbi:hypothetical protein CN193_24825 [Sinorhizobium meliloti]|uniref:hypothetical protein n=1 Tax=Rhizobium meliloti TaxID=382 RepID=UPI000FDA7176|nr:hypothetical protein [Sinorhizobium meliloti]RVI98120.1 hypothetical protein CN193_24825 [Sinorhizobium meliloti]